MTGNQIEAVVHVGLPKTGSTAIQRFLALNASALSGRGIHHDVPRIDRFSQLEYGLAACSRAGEMVNDFIFRNRLGLTTLDDQQRHVVPFEAALAARLEALQGGRFVISSEHIGVWMREPHLREAMDGWMRERFAAVRYIMFVRPQAAFVLSSYSESVKRGSAMTLEEFVRTYGETDIAATIRDWRALLGSRIDFALMPGREAGPDGLLRRFCELVGIDPVGLKMPAPANEALSARAAGVLRRANEVIGEPDTRTPAQRALFAALRKAAMATLSGGPKLALSEAQLASIAERYPETVEDLIHPSPPEAG